MRYLKKWAFWKDSLRFYYVDINNHLKVIDLDKKVNIGVFVLKASNKNSVYKRTTPIKNEAAKKISQNSKQTLIPSITPIHLYRPSSKTPSKSKKILE